jgi:hypothetical protein
VRDAGRDVVARAVEGADRAGAQARPFRAGVAGARARDERREREPLAERERAAVRMPEPMVGMDQDPERRGGHGLRALRPAQERRSRRTVARQQHARAERRRDLGEHARRPAIERIGLVAARARERGPVRAADLSREHDGAGDAPVRERRHAIVGLGMERAARLEPARAERRFDRRESRVGHRVKRRAFAPTLPSGRRQRPRMRRKRSSGASGAAPGSSAGPIATAVAPAIRCT